MTMRLLRRITGLEPAAVTTAPAPRLGGATDVLAQAPAPPQRRAGFGIYDDPPTEPRPPCTQDDVVEVQRPTFPSVELDGCCYHDLHVDFDGERLGILIRDDARSATALRCPFRNEAGL